MKALECGQHNKKLGTLIEDSQFLLLCFYFAIRLYPVLRPFLNIF